MNIDEEKIAKLPTANEYLAKKYGKEGTKERAEFNAKALAWYYGVMLRDRRIELGMTQKQIADMIGSKQSYIARVEGGQTDMQISTFLRITSILGIQFIPNILS